MKQLLGLLFCLAFLLCVGLHVQAQEKNETTKTTLHIDVGKGQDLKQYASITSLKQSYVIDMQNMKLVSKHIVKQRTEALFYRYKLVRDCPVIYINKGQNKYYLSHLYKYSNKYNQPPNYEI